MNRSKRLILVTTAIVSSLILAMVPMITQVSPAQAAITWTRYGGVFDLLPEGVGAASVIEDGATYKMWYTHGTSDFTIDGTTVAIGYATSPNRVTWTSENSTVLDGTGGGAWDDDSVGSPSVIKDGTTYKMWYTGGTTDGSLSGTVPAIGYATSPDGITWTKHTGAVLDGTGGGSWDDDGVGSPCVIYDSDDGKYKMWYTGGTTGGAPATTEPAIGYAYSDNGTDWTKHTGAVLEKSGGDWDNSGIGIACVVKVGLVYHMWYTGATGYSLDSVGAIGYAYSTNGTDWYPDSAPVLEKSSTWESNGVDAPWVIRSGTRYYMWYTGIDSDSDPTIGYAYYVPRVTRGGGMPTVVPGTTDVADVVTGEGVFTETTTTASEDGDVVLTIDEDTIGLTVDGEPLSEISITEMEDPPDQPEDSNVIGLTYDLGPDGAVFAPPIELTFTYDPALIPDGVSEENLVLAFWDGEKWVNLECVVDPETNTITARIGHFTAFTVLAYTRPAAFVASELSISPTVVDIEEEVTISVLVTNTGDLTGSYEVTLKINDVVVATETVTLAGYASQRVTFTTAKDVTGTYSVAVDEQTGTFEVKIAPVPTAFTISDLAITPAEVDIAETVTISVLITNTGDLEGTYEVTLKINDVAVATKDVTLAGHASQRVTFTTAKDVAGTYSVTVDGFTGSFTVKPPPPPPRVNWAIWGSIIAVAVFLVIFLPIRYLRRRRRA